MQRIRSAFLRDVQSRGFVHQCTDINSLDEKASSTRVVAYIGFDCTAPSLHVGSMVSIMLLRRFQQHGHKPVVLMGGGTTKVGDPSFRDEARPLLNDQDIERNLNGIKEVFSRFLTFGDGESDAVMVNNDTWLSELLYIPLLRDAGRHFSVNRMLALDSVRSRLEREQPLSFLEFNYMILQAWDFVELWRRHACTLQMGGSDQWGNIVQGVELGRRMHDAQLFGLTTPLITTASGTKMGKTAAGAVWLDPEMCSPYDYWQYWRNTDDRDVGRFLRLFTDLEISEIVRLESLENEEINEAKKVLADEATSLCHGRERAQAASRTAHQTFELGTSGDELPITEIRLDGPDGTILLYEALRRTGLASSNGDARRLIKGGGARINGTVVRDEFARIDPAEAPLDPIRLSSGKKRHALLRIV